MYLNLQITGDTETSLRIPFSHTPCNSPVLGFSFPDEGQNTI